MFILVGLVLIVLGVILGISATPFSMTAFGMCLFGFLVFLGIFLLALGIKSPYKKIGSWKQ